MCSCSSLVATIVPGGSSLAREAGSSCMAVVSPLRAFERARLFRFQPDAMVLEAVRRSVHQGFNPQGVLAGVKAIRRRELIAAHIRASDMTAVDWDALKRAGIKGAIIDKDNTITEPYQARVHPRAEEGLRKCQQAFDGNIAVFSNSSGNSRYDPSGKEASELERRLALPVLRHASRKPGGGVEDVEGFLGVEARMVVIVGDRRLTDVWFGNAHGMLTVLTQPLAPQLDPLPVKISRLVEERLSWHLPDPPEHFAAPHGNSERRA